VASLSARELVNDAEMEQAFRLRAEVYVRETEMLPAGVLRSGRELDELDSVCWHAGVFDGERLVGYLRIIPGHLAALPVVEEFGVEIKTPSAEISRFLVHRDYRSTTAVIELCALVIRWFMDNDVPHLYAIVEPWFFHGLRRFGFPFMQVGEPTFTYNAENVAIYCPTADLRPGVELADQSRRNQLLPLLFPAQAGAREGGALHG